MFGLEKIIEFLLSREFLPRKIIILERKCDRKHTSFRLASLMLNFTLTLIANRVLPKLSPCLVKGAAV